MQKRGQVISFDLVLSTFIFLGALMFILYQIDNASFQKTQDLSFAEGSVINNLWLNMKNPAYGQTFLADSHIDEAKLQIFESKAYRDAVPDQNFFNDQKSLVLHNLGVAGFAVDFCLYFVNGSGNIKGIGPKAGTGQEDHWRRGPGSAGRGQKRGVSRASPASSPPDPRAGRTWRLARGFPGATSPGCS